jgi:DNA-directed RNA polymerase specialized sigma24 family protein
LAVVGIEGSMSATVAATPTADLRRLVDFAQNGDREALEALYLLHFDRIYSYLHLSVGNRHDAEDLTTQTFLKMLEAIGRFRWQAAPFGFGSRTTSRWTTSASRRWQPEEVPEPEVRRRARPRKPRSSPSGGAACSS